MRNGRRAKQPGLMHAPGVARIFQRKYKGLIQSKIYSGCKLNFQQTFERLTVWKIHSQTR